MYSPKYNRSWALVVGINRYLHTAPLGYAKQDAEAFAAILQSQFEFTAENVTLLTDGDATKERITSSFLAFTRDSLSCDDRIVIFFAGHGHTRTGLRGEIGYLVPVDGSPDDLATLIRWDELTRNADLIPAKHVFFLMDACYGGLAIKRNLPPGSTRFLKDMLRRYSRQVLTAGKPDEPVADLGGPLPNHSIFTGHLLEALGGKAADPNGIITANQVMSYVYEHVAKDGYSQQSPHFGFLDGDGDFIFSAPLLDKLTEEKEKETDILVQNPPGFSTLPNSLDEQPLIERVKDFLSDPQHRIRLDDIVSNAIRNAVHDIHSEDFPLGANQVTPETFSGRLRRYETDISSLLPITILIARWGARDDLVLLRKIVGRLAESIELPRGAYSQVWSGLRWYPIITLMYAAGIAAVSVENYAALAQLFNTKLGLRTTGTESQEAVAQAVSGIQEAVDGFKMLPGHERHFVPLSEYLFKTLQPALEDLLFLGNSYEDAFDRFEVLLALSHADLRNSKGYDVWSPPGRFGWKGRFGTGRSPYADIFNEADRDGTAWAPVVAGLFDGSIDRFISVARLYNEQVLSRLQWY